MSAVKETAPVRSARAVDALTLAEHTVRWEDDVSAAELQLFYRLYADVLRQARRELGQPEGPEPQPDSSRDVLLRLRYEACDMVRRAELQRRSAQQAPKTPWLRYLAGVLVLVLIALISTRDAISEALDLGNVSDGKPWLASSRYANEAALSGTLGDFAEPFFFHTAYEADPWLEIDLGAQTPVRSVSVLNRPDCCSNRALPLVIETSLDHEHWQLAAKRARNFRRWRARLYVDSARWLRLRTARESHLHLKAVVVRK